MVTLYIIKTYPMDYILFLEKYSLQRNTKKTKPTCVQKIEKNFVEFYMTREIAESIFIVILSLKVSKFKN